MNNKPIIKIIPYFDLYQEQVIRLVSYILDEFSLPIKLSDQPDLLHISKFYQKECGNFWLALYNDQVIGTVALVDMGNRQGALRKMFVDKNYRGNEKKVAQSLLDTVFLWCTRQEISEIYLGTRPIFLAAQKFYEKNVFKEISPTCLPSTFPLNPVDSKFYMRNL